MRYRLTFLLVALFFITMNVLLWRSEFGARGHLETPVPADLVWEKVLTSPDDSFLEIRHHGVKIGRARWAANVGEEVSMGSLLSDDMVPEGMVKRLTGYTLDFNGTLSLDDLSRLGFDFTLKLDTNRNWSEFVVRAKVKPLYSLEILASAEKQTVHLSMEEDAERLEKTYAFADLNNPEKILRDLGGPAVSAALTGLGVSLPRLSLASSSSRLSWEARNDRLKIGSNFIRVFRLEARLFDRYRASLFVSPVGEILRMELPDEIVLTNDALTSL